MTNRESQSAEYARVYALARKEADKAGTTVIDLGIGYDYDYYNEMIAEGYYKSAITMAAASSGIAADYLY
jgi:hypothetical protein